MGGLHDARGPNWLGYCGASRYRFHGPPHGYGTAYIGREGIRGATTAAVVWPGEVIYFAYWRLVSDGNEM